VKKSRKKRGLHRRSALTSVPEEPKMVKRAQENSQGQLTVERVDDTGEVWEAKDAGKEQTSLGRKNKKNLN